MATHSLDKVKDLLRQRQYDDALQACDAMLAEDPSGFQLNVFAGKAAFELRQYDKACALP